jgi:hypothetical protein
MKEHQHQACHVLFRVTIITNNLIWWIPFALYLRDFSKTKGGWMLFFMGE